MVHEVAVACLVDFPDNGHFGMLYADVLILYLLGV